MKVLGILGAHKQHGVTAKLLATTLAAVPDSTETETIYLEDYDIHPDIKGQSNPVLDELTEKLLASDVWVFAAPTFWGGLSGVTKNFLDCLRWRLVRIDHVDDAHPARFKNKHYLSITDCYISPINNFFTGITDETFKQIDRVMSAAGVIKIHEIVCPNTFKNGDHIPESKLQLCHKWGARLPQKSKRDDNTMKRYVELFCMIAVMSLITMGIQRALSGVMTQTNFWINWVTFVVIFFVLLAIILHTVTFLVHRRR
ncbi:MAG: NAD(P)H-dependent oxidoreductase [Furfurilactobacillus sp.]|jgi:multimeric flavodoxin WrbA|uniref:NAD(P)H-dependent oxidoreductase n=1 Tax=Furfurilactobacillus milii TaxID=2888272 RepID=A0ABT6DC15_9LACO|nr:MULTISPECIES: NAD(P)H-dependent oxidoreductase [Furfurilactobacillus]QLE67503.1 integral membrane protein [Furfurilactobacillus rossiae]MCF6161720.1 NAD(P)H-dependent oxidoreductase [Furfurilactobacillus milii]MCF6164057.1 NAD(P)H-dependent oxidoreductase [Furfurilactobacillus milii]MCF6419501.1 NAD(P)H-dependent oxidoreductase [Furfurilactobacillus milii]MCH4011634.1 NAD(P)H-dependent oxidoreductase [Furfurilactobacillus sp.]